MNGNYQALSKTKQRKYQRNLRKQFRKVGCFVYVLKDPETELPFYVGQTRLTLDWRLAWHIRGTRRQRGCKRRLSPNQEYINPCLSA